jgi:hypothetical protein
VECDFELNIVTGIGVIMDNLGSCLLPFQGTWIYSPLFFYVAQSSVFCVVFYGLLFFLFNIFWPFYYLSFDLRIPITLLVSSIFSCQCGRLQRNNFPNYPLSPRFQWQYLIQNRIPQFINARYRCGIKQQSTNENGKFLRI